MHMYIADCDLTHYIYNSRSCQVNLVMAAQTALQPDFAYTSAFYPS